MPYLRRGTVFTLVIRTQSTHCWNSSIHFFPRFIDSGRKGTFCGAHGCQSVALQRSAKSISCYTATISTIACCTKTIRPYGEMLHVALTLDSSLDTNVYSVLQDMTRKACTDMPNSRCYVVLCCVCTLCSLLEDHQTMEAWNAEHMSGPCGQVECWHCCHSKQWWQLPRINALPKTPGFSQQN